MCEYGCPLPILFVAELVSNTNGSVVGYKYFNFNLLDKGQTGLRMNLKPQGIDGTIDIMLDSPWEEKGGRKIGSLAISKDIPQKLTEMSV